MMQGKENLWISKLVGVGMDESLQGVYVPVEISGFINCVACQRCDLVKLDHASAKLLLKKQMFLRIVFGMNKKNRNPNTCKVHS